MRQQPPASESERLNEKQTIEENGLEGGEDCSVNLQRESVDKLTWVFIITYTILGAPYQNYGIMGPQTLF